MSEHIDPELQDILRDPELMRFASILSAATLSDPPLDDAFKSGLRRQLMDQAWKKTEGRGSLWRRLFAPQGLAWAGSLAVVVVIASVVVYTASQPPLPGEVLIQSPQQDKAAVALQQPILVAFNQPMDHQSTESAVQITPATSVTYSWQDNTLLVQPTSGNLAPNTQYQVTIGPTALTAQRKPLTAPQSFTFVTQPGATPQPSPRPTPGAGSLLTGEQPLAPIPNGTFYTPQWSADSSTVYFIGQGGALLAAPVHGGPVQTLVADGVSLPASSPASRRIAFVRGGKVEILSLGTSAIVDLTVPSPPQALRWVADTLYVATAEAVYSTRQSVQRLVRVAGLPTDVSIAVVSIAPDGAHVVYQSATTLYLFEVATGTTVRLGDGGTATTFQAWSADGTRVLYNGNVADMRGKTVTTLPSGDPSWSAQNQILLGGDAELDEVGSDGRVAVKLATGSYRMPVWAPDATTFVFLRGSNLWVASAPSSGPHQPTDVDQASAAVTAFMQARLAGNADKASSFLTDAGKAAFTAGGLALIPSVDLGFRRFYIVTAQRDPSAPHLVRVVVRLVFAQAGKLERTAIDEAFTLRQAQDTGAFQVDGVVASAQHALGTAPAVVAVRVTTGEVDIMFDSDLLPSTVAGVVLEDAQGVPVPGIITYADRTVTVKGLQLTPGELYRVVVMPSVKDVNGMAAATEYDLDVIAPDANATADSALPASASPASSPTPAKTPPGTNP